MATCYLARSDHESASSGMKGGRRKITEADFQVDMEEMIRSYPAFEQGESEFMTGLFIRLPVSQREWLKKAADTEDISLAELVRRALNAYRT